MIPCSPKRFKKYNYLQNPYYISYRRHIESTHLTYDILTFFEILQYELQGSHPHTNKSIHCQHCTPELISAFNKLNIQQKLLFMNKIAEGLTESKFLIRQTQQQGDRILCNQKKQFLGFSFYESANLQLKGNSKLYLGRKSQTILDLTKYLVKGQNNQITLIQVSSKKSSITLKFNTQEQHKYVYQQINAIICAYYVEKIGGKNGSAIRSLKSIPSSPLIRNQQKLLTQYNISKFNSKKQKCQAIFKDKEIQYILMAKNHNYKILANKNNKSQFKAIAEIPGISSQYLLEYQNRFPLLISKHNLEKQQNFEVNTINLKIDNFRIKQTVLKECIKDPLGFSIFQQSLSFSQTFSCLLQFLKIQVKKNELNVYALFNTHFASYLQLALNYLNQLCKTLLQNQKMAFKFPDQYEDYFTIIGQQDDQESIYKMFDEQQIEMPNRKTPPTLSASSSQIDKKSIDKYLDKKHSNIPYKRLPVNPQKITVPTKIQMKDHRVFSEWKRKKGGGLVYFRKQKLQGQYKYIMKMVKQYGKKLLEIQDVRNLSIHVGLMAKQSHLTTLCYSHNYCPMLIQPSANKSPLQRIKAIVQFQISCNFMGTSFAKPFNPILGETYQSWINGCPYYSQQISHHPPIASFYLFGRGYTFYGQVQAQAKINMNGVLAFNKRLSYIKYQDGNIVSFSFGFFSIKGLVWGDRQIQFYEPTFVFDSKNKLFAKTTHGPRYKSIFSTTSDRQDYFYGSIYKVSDSFCLKFQKNISKLNVVYPDKSEIIETLSNYDGEWTSHVNFDGNKVFDLFQDLPDLIQEQINPLPSNSWFRQDLISLTQQNIDKAQEKKKLLQQKQRADKKLRLKNSKLVR